MASEKPQENQEVCRRFRNTGNCRFGNECKYQHTQGEPIPVPARQCHKFDQDGSCQFGDICRFVHGPNDPRCDQMGNLRMETQVCRNFRRGACSDGDNCIRRHLDAEGKDVKGQGIQQQPQVNRRPQLEPVKDEEGNEACRRFYYFGVCKWGEKCKHTHVANPNPEEHLPLPARNNGAEGKPRRRRPRSVAGNNGAAAAAPAAAQASAEGDAAPAAARRPRRRAPCKKFALGTCTFGDKCRFRHVIPKAGATPAAEGAAAPAAEEGAQ